MPRPRRKQPKADVPKLPRKRRGGGREVPAVPGDGPVHPEAKGPVDFGRISGSWGGPGYEPPECRPKDTTGSADDMWLRMKQTERSIPEEPSGHPEAPSHLSPSTTTTGRG